MIAILALVVERLARARIFALLFRGLRLLNIDMRERRRELDASAARLERRVAALTAEAEAASKRAEALARRAGGGASVSRAPGPAFLRSLDAPAQDRARILRGARPADERRRRAGDAVAERLIIAIDNLEALAPAEAARLIGPGQRCSAPAAAAWSPAIPPRLRERSRGVRAQPFRRRLRSGALGASDRERIAARMFASGPQISSAARATPTPAACRAAHADRNRCSTALAPLTAGTPRAIKRLHNAYRLARLAAAPRPLVALMLAAMQTPDGEAAKRLRAAMLGPGERLEGFTGPAALVAAVTAVEGAHGGPLLKADTRAAWDAARRYAPSFG